MRDDFKTIKLRRIDICDMMLACLAAKELANDEGKKWDRLRETLKSQLKELDKKLDEIENV